MRGFEYGGCTLGAGGGITDSNSGGVGGDRRAVSLDYGKMKNETEIGER